MLTCLTANHKTCGFSTLEVLARIDAPETANAIRKIPGMSGVIIVSTCNRFEMYLDADGTAAPTAEVLCNEVLAILSATTGLSTYELRESVAQINDDNVPEHLFSVASGLESLAVGEGEISGQIRRAAIDASEAGISSARLEQLFAKAQEAAKQVKNSTRIDVHGRSLVRFSLDLASSTVGSWADARVLLIGTGAYAGASLKALRDKGVRNISVYSPSGRAKRFAEHEEIIAVPNHALIEALGEANLIVSCSTSDSYVITESQVRKAKKAIRHKYPRREAKPAVCPVTGQSMPMPKMASQETLIIDMGMPRNVDPAAAAIDNVQILDIKTIQRHTPLAELDAFDEARCIVARSASEFTQTDWERAIGPAIGMLRERIHEFVEQEIARSASQPEDEAQRIALRRLANRILHEPQVRGRTLSRVGEGDAFVQALQLVFGIDAPAPSEAFLPPETVDIDERCVDSGCPIMDLRPASA